jgi:hypothetical protein
MDLRRPSNTRVVGDGFLPDLSDAARALDDTVDSQHRRIISTILWVPSWIHVGLEVVHPQCMRNQVEHDPRSLNVNQSMELGETCMCLKLVVLYDAHKGLLVQACTEQRFALHPGLRVSLDTLLVANVESYRTPDMIYLILTNLLCRLQAYDQQYEDRRGNGNIGRRNDSATE